MNNLLKVLLGIVGVVIAGVVILVIIFKIEMAPDSAKEEEIINDANQYLHDHFSEGYEVYDALYDNMGNFEFEYAAKVRNTKNGVNFLIYRLSTTGTLVDSYVAEKWTKELENNTRNYLNDHFPQMHIYHASIGRGIGKNLGIDPERAGSYKENGDSVKPHINIMVSREHSEHDEEKLNDFISYLKNEEKIEHGTVALSYMTEKGEIIETEI
ncbi:hypothetical protein NC661_03760 [Aquibacillus koreensis]|uniref:Uncharacterized protein n=1 Tax=Aquibacillus koreensis TaxID=279446 RepID=A0A9X3WGS4_9BACI|nr:hypothetical protein [Aquibacillus koreensis]MCT2536434.1 hypothetical protein [Aquibacillus koreensis]MDC3419477.1 hypothetical protein [Aquibacillus koreensis]